MSSSSLRPVTLRLAEEDLAHARQEAEALGVSVGVYLRMLVRHSLRSGVDPLAAQRAEALRRFSDVMAAEAAKHAYDEDDLRAITKAVRKRPADKS